jgi:solute carrier family 50 protein (sugar transporter)
VVKTRDASSIPVAFSVTSFLCSLAWLLMGLRLNDIFILGPNVIGMGLSSIQLAMVAFYGTGKEQKLDSSPQIQV